ncbi:MAG: hypothetical protein AAF418_05550, partial [Pseudomonadota bacterium]
MRQAGFQHHHNLLCLGQSAHIDSRVGSKAAGSKAVKPYPRQSVGQIYDYLYEKNGRHYAETINREMAGGWHGCWSC